MQAVESALSTEEKLIACISLKTEDVNGQDAKTTDLYEVGTLVNIKRMMRADDAMQLIVQGIDRVKVVEWKQEQPFLKANLEILPELTVTDEEEVEALKRSVQGLIQEALSMLPNVPPRRPRWSRDRHFSRRKRQPTFHAPVRKDFGESIRA